MLKKKKQGPLAEGISGRCKLHESGIEEVISLTGKFQVEGWRPER